MRTLERRKLKWAFTVLELMVVVVVVILLVTVLLPPRHLSNVKSARIHCVNNLKQIGIAYRIWADDNNDLYPMEFYTNANGGPLFLGINVFRYFQALSNELYTPKIIVCPADLERARATNFNNDLDNSHVSYFVGLSCARWQPATLLSGDRNITDGTALQNGLLLLTANHPARWTAAIHNRKGNIDLADGSVQQVDDKLLNAAVAAFGTNINRLGVP